MNIAYISEAGRRGVNQDSVYVPDEDNIPLLLVADGMGGHNAGALASQTAARAVAQAIYHCQWKDRVPFMLKTAVAYANSSVYAEASSSDELSGMGTTLALAYIEGDNYTVANVGDSRVYHYDGYSLLRITRDHSFVAELVSAGKLKEEDAARHPKSNYITRSIGTKPDELVDIFEGKWHYSDILLLCSDGLYRGVTEAQIKNALTNARDLNRVCQTLYEQARDGGSTDDITIIIAKHEG